MDTEKMIAIWVWMFKAFIKMMVFATIMYVLIGILFLLIYGTWVNGILF